MTIYTQNCNAMTAKDYIFEVDYDREFYAHEYIGYNIDAPKYILVGSTIENYVDGDNDVLVRHIIPNITYRG